MLGWRAMRHLLILAAMLASAVLVPLHVGEHHHGEAAESHEGDHHDKTDHEVLATAPVPSSTLAVQPLAIAVVAFEVVPPAPSSLEAGRPEQLHEPPEPDRAASPPSPPRAPPTLRA